MPECLDKKVNCPSNFTCKDKTCLPERWICDGSKDCTDGEDEKNCNKTCPNDYFRCQTSPCIPMSWRCDGIDDCDDNSDEKDCFKVKTEAFCDKEHNKFKCNDGHCIDYKKVCDHVKDCSMGEDEHADCNLIRCTGVCSHYCAIDSTTNQTICLCPPGYQLIDNRNCIVYDECADNKITNVCSQLCINNGSTYECACLDGYRKDGNNCVAMGQSPLLYFSTGTDIRGLNIRLNELFPFVENVKSNKEEFIVALDTSTKNRKLYYSIFLNNSYSAIYEVNIDSHEGSIKTEKDQRKIYQEPGSQIEGISIDSLANNIYFTDSNQSKIVVCSIDSLICATLIENLDAPRGIVVLPDKALLFWTQFGQNNGIFQANMDGKDVVKFFSDVDWPNDLVFDEPTNRLYWCEGRLGRIEYYDFDIEARVLVFENRQHQPYSMYVFEDKLYWNDWALEEIVSCDKIKCHHHRTIYRGDYSLLQFGGKRHRQLLGISMYHDVLQNATKTLDNPCHGHQCSHLCLIQKNNTYTCVCPDNSYVLMNGKDCIKQNSSYLIVSTGSKLYKYFPDAAVSKSIFELVALPSSFAIFDVTFNPENEEIILYDRFKNQIVLFGLHNDRPNRYRTLVNTDLEGVFGLTYEINSNNVYWVDMMKGTLEVVNINNTYRAIINSKLDEPLSLAISPQTKTIYVGTKTKRPQIIALTMDGKYIGKILRTELGLPMTLNSYLNGNALMWGDPILERIDYILFNVPLSSRRPSKLIEKHVGTVQSMAVFDSKLYWTNADSPFIHGMYLNNHQLTDNLKSTFSRQIPMPESVDNEQLRIISADRTNRIYDYCSVNNPCKHICIIGKYGPKCKCAIGYESYDNGLSCERKLNVTRMPIIHILSLDKLLNFILSKQKDEINDTWSLEDELNQEKIAEEKANSEVKMSPIPSPALSTDTHLPRRMLIWSTMISLLAIIAVILLIKL